LIGGLVLAAGAGERFGGPKQLAQLDGRPLLEHVLLAMAAAPLDRVVVVLGAGADEVLARVHLHGAEPVVCADWREGMAASLRAGVEALADADAVVVALGDQPRLSPAAVARVVQARSTERPGVPAIAGSAGRSPRALAVRATYGGVPGHPVLLERALFGRLRELRGDEGARVLLEGVDVRAVECDGLGAPDDVDTPEQLARLA
jgi:molybdenum cofactor cytidylyltransferase